MDSTKVKRQFQDAILAIDGEIEVLKERERTMLVTRQHICELQARVCGPPEGTMIPVCELPIGLNSEQPLDTHPDSIEAAKGRAAAYVPEMSNRKVRD